MNKSQEIQTYWREKEEMAIRNWLILGIIVCLLAGCSSKVGFKTVNTTEADEKQAEAILKEDSRIKNAVLLIHDDRLIAGLRVNTFERFRKRAIAKEMTDRFKELYPEMDITVSADSKIFMETNKLIEQQNKEQYTKEMKELSQLVKEET